MSDTELDIKDIKKILVAQKLFKIDMTVNEMKRVYDSFKRRQAIEAEGLFENGMTDQDIKVLYNTLKTSEESAGANKEYHDILNSTETNCANIDMLIEESNTTNANDETVDVTSIQPVSSPKPQSAKQFYSTFKKKFGKKPKIDDINVFMEVEKSSKHPLLKLRDVRYTNTSLIYYHQTKIQKLPLKERETAITQYFLNLHKHHKNDTNSKIKWSSPILPQQKKPFNGDLCVDFVPDIPEEEVQEETVDPFNINENEIPVKENSYISTRPKRVVKRKNYLDQITDDDDDFTLTKKTRSNDDLISSGENSPESKWLKRKKKAITKKPLYFAQGSNRVNKIFDTLKWGDSSSSKTDNKSTAQNLQETLNLSDSDEEMFPTKEVVTTVNIHDEEQLIKNKNIKTFKAKKTSPKKRAVYNKLSVQKNSSTKENQSPEIPTSNFYAKNKSFEVDESNNNKLEKNEDLTNCPICNRPFPASRIEAHAANCIQYEGKDSETYCDICNENILDKKLQSHRYECLQKITEASIVVDKPVTRSQRTIGFLCEVCDKYIFNTSELQHASNCIAKG